MRNKKTDADAALQAWIVYRLLKGNPAMPPSADAIKQLTGLTIQDLLKGKKR